MSSLRRAQKGLPGQNGANRKTTKTPARLLAVALCVTLFAGLTSMVNPLSAKADPETPLPLLSEDFESGSVSTAPTGWSIENDDRVALVTDPDWQGWVFYTPDDAYARWKSSDANQFAAAQGKVAMLQSDGNRPASGNPNRDTKYTSTLVSPEIDLPAGVAALEIAFDSHYKDGQNNPKPHLEVQFNDSDSTTVELMSFTGNRLNEKVSVSTDVPSGATTATIRWVFSETNNNWFWMIDNVSVTGSEPSPSTPIVTSAARPFTTPGGSITVALEGLREGDVPVLTLNGATAGSTDIGAAPAAGAAGETAFTVAIPQDFPDKYATLGIAGEQIVPTELGITVFTPAEMAGAAGYANGEEQLWFDGFEDPTDWESAGLTGRPWQFTTIDQITADFSSNLARRHAFTRASGTIAAMTATEETASQLYSPTISLPEEKDIDLELRISSHWLTHSGSPQGSITARFDHGDSVNLLNLTSERDRESEQLRASFRAPEEATTVTFEFAFGSSGAGTWLLDDAELVVALPELDQEDVPQATVNVFSDIQGSTAAMCNNVLPGLASLPLSSDTLVVNGDLVSNGSASNYNTFFSSYSQCGGSSYDTRLFTIGNHEYYGNDGAATYKQRYLDYAAQYASSGHGTLWGETLADGALPILWIGSEGYDYPSHTGSGPFFEFSEEQFQWLRDRLEHWKAENKPVLLLSHHVFPYTVSGTYINFNKRDFGDDQERLEALLAAYPNVVMLTSHTHWTTELSDWAVEKRFTPDQHRGVNIINTQSVTTVYGPSGDWGETGVSGGTPAGLQVALYGDRLRTTAYNFDASGEVVRSKFVDVALPSVNNGLTRTVPQAPAAVPAQQCGVEAEIDLPEVDGVKYTVATEGSTATVTAAAEPGYYIPSTATTTWTLSVAGEACPPDPVYTRVLAVDEASPKQGDQVTVTGTDWKPGEQVTLTLESGVVPLGTVEVTGEGTFSAAVVIPEATQPGAHRIIATAVDAETPSHVAVEVVQKQGPVDPVYTRGLSVDKTSPKQGDQVTVTGSDWKPGEVVTLELHSDPVALGTATVTPEGTFSAVVTIPEATQPGSHHIAVMVPGVDQEFKIELDIQKKQGLTDPDPDPDKPNPEKPGTKPEGKKPTIANTGANLLPYLAGAGIIALALGVAAVRRSRES